MTEINIHNLFCYTFTCKETMAQLQINYKFISSLSTAFLEQVSTLFLNLFKFTNKIPRLLNKHKFKILYKTHIKNL
jgi:hypothetical protein